jgi:hypothetical protein
MRDCTSDCWTGHFTLSETSEGSLIMDVITLQVAAFVLDALALIELGVAIIIAMTFVVLRR